MRSRPALQRRNRAMIGPGTGLVKAPRPLDVTARRSGKSEPSGELTHKLAEPLPLVLQSVPSDGLVVPNVLEADRQAVLPEAAVGSVAARVRRDDDGPRGHRLESRHVEALLGERRRQEDIGPLVELSQLLPTDRRPYRLELEAGVAGECSGHPVAHPTLPGGVADLQRTTEAAEPLLREVLRFVNEQDHLRYRGLVQVRADRFQDHVVSHDAGHGAREQAHSVAPDPVRVRPPHVLHDKDDLLVLRPPAEPGLHNPVVRRPGEEGELVRADGDLFEGGENVPVLRLYVREALDLEERQPRLVSLWTRDDGLVAQ